MFFVNNSKGYSRGGFNTLVGLPANLVTYQPESLNNIEVGMKTDFDIAGMPARTNLSGYYGFYDNVQVSVPATFTDTRTGITRFTSLNQNAAEGHIYGVDGDFSIIPVDPLTLNFSVAYLQAQYDRYIANGVDVSQTPFILAPKWKYVIRGTYRLPIDSSLGEVSISANYNWQSRWVGQAELNPPIQDTNPPFGNLDMNLTWTDFVGTEGLNATLFVTNVTNNVYTDSMLPVWNSLGYTAITPAAPRMWGVRARYSF
jgi:iron complex outermembrane receptor protein